MMTNEKDLHSTNGRAVNRDVYEVWLGLFAFSIK